jgi:cysteine desulfurase
MSTAPIYLDHAATTAPHPAALDAMARVAASAWGNPASQHRVGARARRLIDDARESIAALLGANPDPGRGDQLVFTSGGTEANALALSGLAPDRPGALVTSRLEHASITATADHLARTARPVHWLPVEPSGLVRLASLESLSDPLRLVSLQPANQETGILQPLPEAVRLASLRHLPVHSDATQWIGKLPFDFATSGLAAITCTPHKFGGPLGIGLLLVRAGLRLEPKLHGGSQQYGLRPGTESPLLVAGFQAALAAVLADLERSAAHRRALAADFETHLLSALGPRVVILGRELPRLPGFVNVAVPGLDRQLLQLALDQVGVCCSTGSACASGSSEPSPVLRALGLPDPLLRGALRFTFGPTNTAAEARATAEHFVALVRRLAP